VSAEAEDGSLIGLLTLALNETDGKLTGAGERHAEYQCWLEPPGNNDAFIKEAMRKIRMQFPGMALCLKYMPPDTPVGWISRDQELSSYSRPLMEINKQSIFQQNRSRNHKRKQNSLKKYGAVNFVRVTEHSQFLKMFDEICVQYDFRQAALNNVMPFSNDPFKKPFHIELHKRGLLHTTILTVGGKIAASHCGLLGKNCVHQSLNTNSPAFADHSPGIVHFALLSMHLARENIPLLDLTPGGDQYKEHFATSHDTVFELNMYDNAGARLKNEARSAAIRILKKAMQKSGVNLSKARLVLGRLDKPKEIGFRGIAGKMLEATVNARRVYRYVLDTPKNGSNPVAISKDRLEDSFRFDPHDSAMTRQEFIATAMARFKKSCHAYTFIKDEKLALCCWVDKPAENRTAQASHRKFQFPDGAVVLFGLYVHNEIRNAELFQGFIEQILQDLGSMHGINGIYLTGAFKRNVRQSIEQCGFLELIS
jgi:CelD/BcsL family acetyltransferase involved in cellulose biosynthesis